MSYLKDLGNNGANFYTYKTDGVLWQQEQKESAKQNTKTNEEGVGEGQEKAWSNQPQLPNKSTELIKGNKVINVYNRHQ